MATTKRDIDGTTFDENVRRNSDRYPECDGRVATNAAETVCDGCGLVVDDRRSTTAPSGEPST